MRYDLIVLGHDHLGRAAALEAAQRRKRVALIESRNDTVPSAHSIREAARRLMELGPFENWQSPFNDDRQRTMQELWRVANEVSQEEASSFEARLRQHGADFLDGRPCFVGPNEVEVRTHSNVVRRLTGDNILLAVGTKSIRPSWIPFDGRTILDSDELLALPRLPKSMIVIGADQAALESAMFLATFGTCVVFVDPHPKLLESWDRELVHRFRQQAERRQVRFRLGRAIQAIEKTRDDRVVVRLERGKNLLAECVLYAVGRFGNTSSLNLDAADLLPDEQGRLWCNNHGQTWVNHIFGMGDVVGFPALARATLDQSRRIIEDIFGEGARATSALARGLLTTPELAMVGATEEQLRHDLVAYEVGIARFRETTRPAMLKLLFHRESLELLGVHCLSESATELIALGETVMSLGGTIESFRDRSFCESPLSECFRQAAENGFARLADESLATSRPRKFRSRSRIALTSQRRPLSSPR